MPVSTEEHIAYIQEDADEIILAIIEAFADTTVDRPYIYNTSEPTKAMVPIVIKFIHDKLMITIDCVAKHLSGPTTGEDVLTIAALVASSSALHKDAVNIGYRDGQRLTEFCTLCVEYKRIRSLLYPPTKERVRR